MATQKEYLIDLGIDGAQPKNNKVGSGRFDFIDKIVDAFASEYERANGSSYSTVNRGKERSAAAKLHKEFRTRHPHKNTEETLEWLKKYFETLFKIDNKWYRDNMSLPLLISKFNEINNTLRTQNAKNNGTAPTTVPNNPAKLSPKAFRPANEMSLYTGDIVSYATVVNGCKAIKQSFPALTAEFYSNLFETVKQEGFTDARFMDAVSHVIKTCVFSVPGIADFVSFDKKVRVYDYNEYLKQCNDGYGKSLVPVKLGNPPKPVWIHINDVEENNLTVNR